MSQFSSGSPATYTPEESTTTLPHWVLTVLTAGQIAKIKMITWGGSGEALKGYVTRWARVNNTPATPTALLVAPANPLVTPMATCNTYGTKATGVADNNLHKQNWNGQGGGGALVLPIGGEWSVVGGAIPSAFNQIGAGNVKGNDADKSSYTVQWDE